MKTKNSRQ